MADIKDHKLKHYKTLYRGSKFKKTHKAYFCQCGNEISGRSKTGRCKSCSNRDRAGTYHLKNYVNWATNATEKQKKEVYARIVKKRAWYKPSKETLLKMRIANIGKHNNPWNKGLTKETSKRLAKMAHDLSTKPRRKEWGEHISKARTGKKYPRVG